MPFTYLKSKPGADIQQGDVLKRTDALQELIRTCHPSYLKDDYTNFMVVTQSCDLVRRSGMTRYIEICAVRPLNLVIDRYARTLRHGVMKRAEANSSKDRGKVGEFLRKLLNNNVHEHFYIEEDLTLEVPASCAFLRLSIPLKLEPNYTTFAEATLVSLRADFQAKFGWLVGDIYSRVGTEDWTDKVGQNLASAKIEELLDENVFWLTEESVKVAQKELKPGDIEGLDAAAVRERIARQKPRPKREELIDFFIGRLESNNFLSAENAKAARNEFRNDTTLTGLLK